MHKNSELVNLIINPTKTNGSFPLPFFGAWVHSPCATNGCFIQKPVTIDYLRKRVKAELE